MPDPQVVYIVTAAVIAGLVAWVIVVLWRARERPPVPSAASTGEDNTADTKP